MSSMIRTLHGTTPIVLDSPHSGTDYPADFQPACDLAVLRRAEDTHVEKLYDFAEDMGLAWIEALFPRSYLDANRGLNEVDTSLFADPWSHPVSIDARVMAKVRLGKGLIWRTTDEGIAIYQRKLTVAEVENRIEQCWLPYHAAVERAIESAHARFGYCIHINCHSMPSVASSHSTEFPGEVHPDFVVGNRDESTSSGPLALLICQHLRASGHSVAYNHPYKGVELVRRYGRPGLNRHSIQIEINRKLYMNEETLNMHDGAVPLKELLRSMVDLLLHTDPRPL